MLASVNPHTRLVIGSIVFAVLWTVLEILWTGIAIANIAIYSVVGIVAGVLWYFGMRFYMRKTGALG